jgi:hypothetical protein
MSACGGGGDSAVATPTAPKTLNDDFIAFKLALIMFSDGPLGNQESRTRGTAPYGWDKKTATETFPCLRSDNLQTQVLTYTNPDGIPSVGDKRSIKLNCTSNNNPMNVDWRFDSEILSLTAPSFPMNQDWTLVENHSFFTSYSYATTLQGREFTFRETVRLETNGTYTTAHSANDTEIQSAKRVSKFVETTQPVGSELIRTTQYSCKYPAGISINPDCSDTTVTAVGTLSGVSINAKLVPVAGNPTKFEIVDGAIKYSVQFTAHPTLQLDDKYTVTLPSGRVINGSGEDVNWVSGTLY